MRKIINIIICMFLLYSCIPNNKVCIDEFNKLYTKRYSLWYAMDKYNLTSNSNFSKEEYKKICNNLSDSLNVSIDCAIKNDKKNQTLLLYKMKQFFISNNLKYINPFFLSINEKSIKKDIYFQLFLYNTLSEELLNKTSQIDNYKKIKEYFYTNNLNYEYKDRATEYFLNYLIDNNIEEFKYKMSVKYPSSNSMSLKDENSRVAIIQEIMARGDSLVFD